MNFGHKLPRYPRVYEANPVGPPITYEDFLKTAAALRGVLMMVRLSTREMGEKEHVEAFKQIGRMLTAEIGRQWSALTAMQYLTGQRADKALNHWREAFEQAGMTRRMTDALVAVANDFCANGQPGRALSAGLLVGEYKKTSMGPEVMLELLGLPADVIDKVKASAQRAG